MFLIPLSSNIGWFGWVKQRQNPGRSFLLFNLLVLNISVVQFFAIILSLLIVVFIISHVSTVLSPNVIVWHITRINGENLLRFVVNTWNSKIVQISFRNKKQNFFLWCTLSLLQLLIVGIQYSGFSRLPWLKLIQQMMCKIIIQLISKVKKNSLTKSSEESLNVHQSLIEMQKVST